MANRKVPLALCRGDTIAFISPSARLNHIFPAPLNRAKSHLERLGYRVKVIFNQSESLIFRDSILQRREEIQSAFADPLIKAIICTVDDSHANELLPHLDYGLIRMNAAITELGITHSHCNSPSNISSTCFKTQSASQLALFRDLWNGLQNCLTSAPTPSDLENNFHRRAGRGCDPAKQQVASSVAVYRPSST